MKKIYSFALMALTMGFVFVSCDKDKDNDNDVEVEKSYTLSISLNKADSVYLGTSTATSTGSYFRDDISIDPFVLTHTYASWGFGEGFTFTSCANDTTAGFTNLSAITKKGVKTNAYFISNAGAWETPAEISFKDGKAYNVKECYVTNSVYAYLAIKDRNDGNPTPYVKDWTAEDCFKLTITGYKDTIKTGSVDFKLADGMSIVDTWQKIDLTKLGKVTKLNFSLSSTDEYGGFMNTPAYFCLDQLTVTE